MGSVGLVDLADDLYLAELTPGPATVVDLNHGWHEALGIPEDGL